MRQVNSIAVFCQEFPFKNLFKLASYFDQLYQGTVLSRQDAEEVYTFGFIQFYIQEACIPEAITRLIIIHLALD